MLSEFFNGSRRLPELILSSYKLERSWGMEF